jgi:DNA-binding transcriptional regulator GbsR (MarR family)
LGAMPRREAPAISVRTLTDAQDRFIAAWGQMGSTWGISRTMAEIHALLYITADALNTDEVMERLAISRGNASMSLRALCDWGIVSKVHKRGDRKEYFQAEADVWVMLKHIIRERLRREVQPVLASIFEIRDLTSRPPASAAEGAASGDLAPPERVAEHHRRLDALADLIQTIDRLGERFVGSEGKSLQLAANILSKLP